MNELQVENRHRADTAPAAATGSSPSICIHHSGRHFVATREHASIFLRRVQDIADRRISELVPLLHSEGVDLLLVSATSPMRVHDVRDRSFDGRHRSDLARSESK
jgi:hypothetical protein